MTSELTGIEICDTCGQSLTGPIWYTPNSFRLRVNGIKNLDQLIASKKYLSRCIESRYNKVLSYNFLEALEKKIENHNHSRDIEYIKKWLLEMVNTVSSKEMEFYEFLKDNYSDINETFTTLYNNYIRSVDNPLNKNQISRALTALGLKTMTISEKHNNQWKAIVRVCASKDRLSEIFRENGL
jgi:hypothetical protein